MARIQPGRGQVVLALLQLTKPRIILLVLVACTLGLLLASAGDAPAPLLACTLLGTALMAGGACALNQYLDRDIDGLMERTRSRPLPSGILAPVQALVFGVLLVLGGCLLLAWRVNLITAFLGLLSAFVYVLVYTPLRRLTWLGTSLGALPGAIPPLMGWTAATNHVAPGGWLLFAMLLLWQHVHVQAIAWIYRDDYRRAGLRLLSALDPSGGSTFRQIVVAAALLLAASLLPGLADLTGPAYRWGAPLAGGALLVCGLLLARRRSTAMARVVMLASVWYLPLLLVLVCMDRACREIH